VIVVVGSINLDLVADVERLPKPGETLPGSVFRTAPGGKGANQALAAARAGAKVAMLGAVGKDAFAEEALALLKSGGVDLSPVRHAAAATGVALIFVDGEGENVIVIVPGANGTVLPGDIDRLVLKKGDVVLLQHEIPLDTVAAAIAAARKAEALSVLNTAPFRREAVPFVGEADYIVANETEFDLYSEALGLSGDDRASRMLSFAGTTGRTVVVTLGAEGVLAASPGGLIEAPALRVKPVDTVGAGDTFCGYLAAGLERGTDLAKVLVQAAAAGSIACLEPGAQPSIPSRARVDEALKRGSA
jgi:ribokinase